MTAAACNAAGLQPGQAFGEVLPREVHRTNLDTLRGRHGSGRTELLDQRADSGMRFHQLLPGVLQLLLQRGEL
ncbi:hypothetical protein BXU08_14420 [Sphingomonas sp. LM7]|nr:hypothetical protein BXU08_14420 [Sphingomonas sp. LM7]